MAVLSLPITQKEGLGNYLIRTIGFFAVLVIDVLMNASFFANLGKNLVLPALGIVFVFLKTWHFIRMIEAKDPTKKRFHFTGWLTMAVISIFATVSFGLALTQVSTSLVAESSSNDNLTQQVTIVRMEQLLEERTQLPSRISQNEKTIQIKEEEKATIGSTGWSNTQAQNRLNDEIAVLRKANETATTRLDAIDAELVTLQTKLEEKSETLANSEGTNQIDAILIFSQIFPPEFARTAILFFFFIIGLAIEVTMAMALLPAEVKKEEEPTVLTVQEPVALEPVAPVAVVPTVEKKKRNYTRRIKAEITPNLEVESKVEESTPSAKTLEKTKDLTEAEAIKEAISSPVAKTEDDDDEVRKVETIRDSPKPEVEKVRFVKRHAKVHDFITALFNNGDKKFLKDMKLAFEEADIPKADAVRVFDYLSSHKHEGVSLIEFRKHTGNWHPNFTSEWILNHLNATGMNFLNE